MTTTTTLQSASPLPETQGGTGNTTALTSGSVVFRGSSAYSQDNSKLFWDNTNKRLGIGTSSPSVPLEVSGSIKSSSISFGTTTGLVGTTTNDNAATGSVGEYVSSWVPSYSAISLPSSANTNITSISLTAGDWDVGGSVYITNTLASITTLDAWINNVDASDPDFTFNVSQNFSGINSFGSPVPCQRFSLSTTTTIYLTANILYGSGTGSGAGYLWARRAR